MLPLIALAAVAPLALAQQNTLPSYPFAPTHPNPFQCTNVQPVYSCENTTVLPDLCCSPYPGGLVLSTQFWDTYTGMESIGQLLPDNGTWTLHGLWPDFCDGSYTQYCDLTRQFDPAPSPNVSNGVFIPSWNGTTVDVFIKDFARFDLLQYMDRYWVNQGDTNAHFWAHEFSKHATCFSTWDTKCFSEPYVEHEEMIDFYETAIRIYQSYPTGTFLRSHGIVPSNSTQYNLTQLQSAVKAHTGAIPYFGCTGPQSPNKDGRTVLDEVWYFNHVLGSPNTGYYKHIDSLSNSSCTPTGGIWYYERTPSSVRPASDVFW